MPPTAATNKKQKLPSGNAVVSQQKTKGTAQENSGKRMQSYCLRYSLRVMDKHAKQQQQQQQQQQPAAAQNTSDPSEGKVPQQHITEIMARVKKRLRDEMLPNCYRKAEDPCVEILEQSNKQRKMEIQSDQKAIDKLERQITTSRDQLQDATKLKDRFQRELNPIRKKAEQLDPALTVQPPSEQSAAVGALLDSTATPHHRAVLLTATPTEYKRAPTGTMSELLQRLTKIS